MSDRIYLELQLSKSVETDANGNYIIYAEASNENLDFQEQVVLQRALLNSQDYFMKNGVISWDHLHKRKDERGIPVSDPEYIIGQPLSVGKQGDRTFVKAMLFKGNRIVEDLVSKLKSGATIIKTSVGGMRPVIEKVYDRNLGKMVEKVTSVLWDELALTYKPVNQTISPVQFVKSLQLGSGTDSASMTGGRSLVPQDLDGAGKRKNAIKAVIIALATGEVTDKDSALAILRENGVEDSDEADSILKVIVAGKSKARSILMDDTELTKSFDDSISELEKALGGAPMPPKAPKATVPPAPKDDDLVEDDEEGEEGDEEGHDEPDGDEGGDDTDGDGDGTVAAPPMKKSADVDESAEFLDVTPFLEEMHKSITEVKEENKALRAELSETRALLKSMAGNQVQLSRVMKSIADVPQMRKSVVSKHERSFGGGSGGDGKPTPTVDMSREEILEKSMLAVRTGKMEMRQHSILEDRLNKGLLPDQKTIEILKSVQ